MPRAPRRGCAHAWCPNLAVPGGRYCEEHKGEDVKRYDRYQRRPEHGKVYGGTWKRIRDRYATAHPLCERCLDEGRTTLMKEVHHIVPVSRGGTHDESNLMSLCQSCHTKIHVRELKDRTVRN